MTDVCMGNSEKDSRVKAEREVARKGWRGDGEMRVDFISCHKGVKT